MWCVAQRLGRATCPIIVSQTLAYAAPTKKRRAVLYVGTLQDFVMSQRRAMDLASLAQQTLFCPWERRVASTPLIVLKKALVLGEARSAQK
jgi:hypothetical protein